MVYSTCSMNPVENEAVVAEILRRCGGSVELLDVSSELPQLVRRPGLKKWKVRDKGAWLASYKDVRKFRRTLIVPSMFPSGESCVDTTYVDQKAALGEVCDNGSDGNSANVSELPEDQMAQTDALGAEVSALPLERCMRIVPHDQNTGAFFIAVFQKLTSLPASQLKPVKLRRQLDPSDDDKTEDVEDEVKEHTNGMEVDPADVTDEPFPEAIANADVTDEPLPEATANDVLLGNESEEAILDTDPSKMPEGTQSQDVKAADNAETGGEKGRGKRKMQTQGKWKGVDPVVFFKDDAILAGIKSFYGIEDSFPFYHHLVTRNSDTNHVKRIYYISKSVKDVLELNFLGGQQLKITSIGLKMFERQTSREGTDSSCAFRISSEGLPLLLPYLTKQILFASPVDFKHLLQYKIIKFTDFVDTEFGEKASKLNMGCCAVVLKKGGQTLLDPLKLDSSAIAIGCWRGRTNVAVMVTAIDCQELLERLLVRMETEKGSSLLEDKPSGNYEADEALKMTDTEVKEDTDTITPATVD